MLGQESGGPDAPILYSCPCFISNNQNQMKYISALAKRKYRQCVYDVNTGLLSGGKKCVPPFSNT